MSPSSPKVLIAAGVFVFSFVFLYHHMTAGAGIDVSRDAMMFGSEADSSRTLHIRTDFASFYYASKAVLHGINFYRARTLDSLAAADGVTNHVLPYLYPPFLAVVAGPLAEFSPEDAQRVWDVAQAAAIAIVCVLVFLTLSWRKATAVPATWWLLGGVLCAGAVIIMPFRSNIDFGQINVFVLLFMSLSFFLYFQGRMDWMSGVFVAVAGMLKVTPLLFIVFFLVNRKWRVVSGCCVGLLVLTLATFDVAGKQPWQQFLEFLPNMGYARNVDGGFHPSIVANFSLAGFLMRVFVGESSLTRLLTMLSTIVLFVVLLYHHLKYASERNEAGFILSHLVLMVVASPVTWLHHLVYLFPGVVFSLRKLWFEHEGMKRLGWLVVVAMLVVASCFDFQSLYPTLNLPEGVRPFATSMNLYFLLLLFVAGLYHVRTKRSLLVTT